MTEANAAHSASVTINVKKDSFNGMDVSKASSLFSYYMIYGQNCSTVYISATNKTALPSGSRFHTYLTKFSSDSGWESAESVGNTATSRSVDPNNSDQFSFVIELQVNNRSYIWEFSGQIPGATGDGHGEICNKYIASQTSFKH